MGIVLKEDGQRAYAQEKTVSTRAIQAAIPPQPHTTPPKGEAVPVVSPDSPYRSLPFELLIRTFEVVLSMTFCSIKHKQVGQQAHSKTW